VETVAVSATDRQTDRTPLEVSLLSIALCVSVAVFDETPTDKPVSELARSLLSLSDPFVAIELRQ